MDKICNLLWNHVRVHVDGKVLPCCQFDYLVPGSIKDIPDVTDGIEAAFSSEYFNTVRRKMLNGERIPECHKCMTDEDSGLVSMRTEFNKLFTETDVPKIRYIETALSTHCNLACRMCNETFSSKWFQYKNPKTKVDTSVNSATLTYYNSDLSELERIKLVGGEPMLDRNHITFLKKMFGLSKTPEEISLHYHTNGTVKPTEKTLSFWRKAKEVEITFSIDGIGKINEILRPPHKWKTIVDNINLIKSLDDINLKLNIHSVVSVLNIKHIENIIQFAFNDMGLTEPDQLTFDLLYYPDHLSVLNTEPSYKQEIIDFVKENYISYDEELVDSVISQMMASKPDKVFSKSEIIDIEKLHTYFSNSELSKIL